MISRRIFAVHHLAWSPDGQRLAVAGYGKTTRILDASTLGTQCIFRELTYSGRSVAWSPDGTRIATKGEGAAYVWDSASGDLLFTCTGYVYSIYSVAWSPNGALIAIVTGDNQVFFHDASTGLLLFRRPAYNISLAWSPDGRWIASGGITDIKIWSPLTGEIRLVYSCQVIKYVMALTWSPDSQQIAAGGYDPAGIEILSAVSGEMRYLYQGHSSRVLSVDWSPTLQRSASGSHDRTVQVWNAESGKLEHIFRGHTKLVRAVAWSSDGVRIASGSEDGAVQVWTPEVDAE